jgi:fructosamine-3-kinase
MRLPPALHEVLNQKLANPIQETRRCSGGDINQAAQLMTAEDKFFVKWNHHSDPGMFEAEARGLAILREAGTLRVPAVIAFQAAEGDCPAFLVLEWLEEGRSQERTKAMLGEGLAALHQHTAEKHGLDHSNFIGSLPQYNQPTESWTEFYAEQRIRPQMAIARQRGRLPENREKLLNRLIDRLPNLLPGENPPASLLHGDLWAGNYLTLADGNPAIIDPAVYYGHREVEMAFTQLFGGFGASFYDAYNSVYPLDKGYNERRSLYQLYPLMVHMNLFGGGYAMQVDSVARRYV